MPPRKKRFRLATSPRKRQALETGPGTPAALMTSYANDLLLRYRQVAPFPVAHSAFLATVYPPEIFLPVKDPQWENLSLSINWNHIAHFRVNGRDREDETFWLKLPAQVPTPPDILELLLLHESNMYFKKINEWVDTALIVHRECNTAVELLRDYYRSVYHPAHVKATWPELVTFIGPIPRNAVTEHVDELNHRRVQLPSREDRETITLLLAKCSLLPDSICDAWVQFPEGE